MRLSASLLSVSALLLVNCQSVQTPDDGRAWGIAEPISNPQECLRPDVAMDPKGNAVAVWDEGEVGVFYAPEDIRSGRYAPGVGWSTPDNAINIPIGPAAFARVAMDGDGNAVAVWQQEAADRLDIWSNRYTPSTRWGIGKRIETEDGNARRPEVAMDPQGNAVAVWYQSDGTRNNIWSNRYTPDEGWGDAEPIERNDGEARWPQVAMDPSGNAVAAWQQCDVGDCDCVGEDCDYSRWNVWSNRYTSGRWGTHRPIGPDIEGNAIRPHVGVDATGNAVAVWQQSDGIHNNIWSSRNAASSATWEGAEPIETLDTGDASRPQVAMDPQGNAVAVWSQFDGTSDDIWSNRYTPSGGWGLAERIEGIDPGEARRPKVAIDPGGTAVVVWTQPDGVHVSIWSNRYTPSFGWGTAEPIETWDGGRAREPEVAMDPNGEAIAVWSQRTRGADEIWSNRLTWRDANAGSSGGSDGEGNAQGVTE